MNTILKSLAIAALTVAPYSALAEDRGVSIAPIAQWGSSTDDADDHDDGTDTPAVTNGPIIIIGDRPGRRDDREERRDRFLPQSCLETYYVSGRAVRLFEAACLRASHVENHELPRACQVTIRTSDGQVRGYEPDCLRNEGYRLAGR